jgi:hypothetical protein
LAPAHELVELVELLPTSLQSPAALSVEADALLRRAAGDLSQPIADVAGTDISHWFNAKTGDVKRHMNVETGIEQYFTPMGRFVHIPPTDPTDDFNTCGGRGPPRPPPPPPSY